VRRHKDQSAAFKLGLFDATAVQDGRVRCTEQLQRVDYCVPRNRTSLSSKARPEQIGLRLRGRRQQDRGDCVNDLPVSFLREGIGEVAATQPRFDMRDRDVRIEPGERPGHCRGRVALDENEVRPAV